MSDNNLATKKDLSIFYNNILPYLGGGMKLAGPVGMIISYMGTTAPSGYLACDGSWYDIGLYPKLANWMMSEFGSYSYFALSGETVQSGKFKVPDLRGEFLRGTGTNSHANQGSGANVGEHQDGTLHLEAVSSYVVSLNFGDNININPDHRDAGITRIRTASQSTDSNGALYTSRPTNTSVLYCIKYEEYEGDGRGVQYSTKEQVIGTWIDGKPLYQKTVDVANLAIPEGITNIAHNISNIGEYKIVKKAIIIALDGTNYSLPYFSKNGTAYTAVHAVDETTFKVMSTTNWATTEYSHIYITIQYTKTT